MAIPTFTSIDPTSGPTKGTNLVKIEGTNFRLPPSPPAEGPVGGPAQKTVSVQFDGVESSWAHAITSDLIYATVPEWTGADGETMPVDLDVRIANLDDSGVEIPGEVVIAADAYAVDRPVMTTETDFQIVISELIGLFRRHVIENVWITLSKFYSDDVATGLDLVKRAGLPLLHIQGPSTVENRFYSLNRLDPEEDPADPFGWIQYKEPVTVDLSFELVGWTDNSRHLYGMGQALVLLLRDHKWLTVPIDPNDPAAGTKRYELDMPFEGQPVYDSIPVVDNLRSFRATCMIRGVDVDERDGLILRRGYTAHVGEGYGLQVESEEP